MGGRVTDCVSEGFLRPTAYTLSEFYGGIFVSKQDTMYRLYRRSTSLNPPF